MHHAPFQIKMMIAGNGSVGEGAALGGGLLDGGAGMIALFALVGLGVSALLYWGEGDAGELEIVPETGEGQDMLGTMLPDTLIGTPGNDTIEGLDGSDQLLGELGDDVILGQGDDDIVVGDGGDDTLYGGTGHDIMGSNGEFSPAVDQFTEMAGDDLIFGGFGADKLWDMRGANTIFGESGFDEIDIRDSREALNGSAVEGAPRTPDLAYGGVGDDLFYLDDGDVVFGDEGFDEFIVDVMANVVDDLDEGYVTIGDWEVDRDILRITDPNGVYQAYDSYTLEANETGEGIWVVLGETRLVLILGNGNSPAALAGENDIDEIIVASPT